MGIISRVGRNDPRVRILHGFIYMTLILGSVVMIYPFLIMLAGSTKSGVDSREFVAVPGFMVDDNVLYRKHVEGLFNESLTAMRETYQSDVAKFERLDPPPETRPKLVDEWLNFLRESEISSYSFGCGYIDTPNSKTIPSGQRAFKSYAADTYGHELEDVNAALGTHFATWNWFFDSSAGDRSLVIGGDCLPRYIRPVDSGFARAYEDFKRTQPMGNRYYLSVEGFFKDRYLKNQYTTSIDNYNAAHGTSHDSYDAVRLARAAPPPGRERDDWEAFVRNTLNLLWIRADDRAVSPYRTFLKARYGEIAVLNRNYETSYASFADVPLVGEPPVAGIVLSDWETFITGWKDPDTGTFHIAPLESLRVHSVELMFRDHLRAKYGTVKQLNAALAVDFSAFADILPPQQEAHYRAFTERRAALRTEFVLRNYRTAMDYMVFHGRGIGNTAVYCALAVFFALLVNPMAAYAMSRYRMPGTYKILLFLMLTMAFPPMVTQIPVFIMLRELGLLNTFAALVLPGLANGYAIFLLKGFFDSLPRELYESAQLDGANEWTMFWRITMSLSKPILAVVALQAFTVAYSNFMFALLICQDQKMWTLMVWLHQLQQRSGPGVVYASLIIAAIPTFIIFVFCQRIIMRGIVIPSEK
jgi:ABC-type glycerol-3-phosphate transport system permease component